MNDMEMIEALEIDISSWSNELSTYRRQWLEETLGGATGLRRQGDWIIAAVEAEWRRFTKRSYARVAAARAVETRDYADVIDGIEVRARLKLDTILQARRRRAWRMWDAAWRQNNQAYLLVLRSATEAGPCI